MEERTRCIRATGSGDGGTVTHTFAQQQVDNEGQVVTTLPNPRSVSSDFPTTPLQRDVERTYRQAVTSGLWFRKFELDSTQPLHKDTYGWLIS
jgi:hypothetical protein